MNSKLKTPALKMAGWGLLHAEFFDLYDVVEAFEIPSGLAGQLMIYLRTMHSVELVAEARVGLKEQGRANKRMFFQGALPLPRRYAKSQEGSAGAKVGVSSAAVDQAGQAYAFTAGSSLKPAVLAWCHVQESEVAAFYKRVTAV
ncbi:hypothetical protein [Aeromonas sp. 600282]|uniref:hypothetical protein n=1 Tax=Aeromonas sp. 600282 TaxID=2712027 RepID=UPI003BA172DE